MRYKSRCNEVIQKFKVGLGFQRATPPHFLLPGLGLIFLSKSQSGQFNFYEFYTSGKFHQIQFYNFTCIATAAAQDIGALQHASVLGSSAFNYVLLYNHMA